MQSPNVHLRLVERPDDRWYLVFQTPLGVFDVASFAEQSDASIAAFQVGKAIQSA